MGPSDLGATDEGATIEWRDVAPRGHISESTKEFRGRGKGPSCKSVLG